MIDCPTTEELTGDFDRAADFLAECEYEAVPPQVEFILVRNIGFLKRAFTAGFGIPPDLGAADYFVERSRQAYRLNLNLHALRMALRGLRYSPHHPELYVLAGNALYMLELPLAACLCLDYALWVNPAHPQARDDLDTIIELLRMDEDDWVPPRLAGRKRIG